MVRWLLGAILLVSAIGMGKNLEGRGGVGLTHLDLTGGPAISIKYFHNSMLATDFVFGFNTENAAYQLGLKSLRNVVLEENINVYLGVAGFLESIQDTVGRVTGLEFDALVGGEFFLSGLPNLGITFEIGIGLRSLRTTAFRAVGGAFGQGAIHYYF
jgi:hypothetical protein